MTMYEELVKALRTCSERDSCFWLGDTCPYLNSELCDDKSGKAADAIEELSKMLDEEVEVTTALGCNMPVWIPVSERLPPIGEEVIVFADRTTIRIWSLERYYPTIADVFWEREDGFHEDTDVVSHWMPLPEPPKDGAE